MQVIHCAQQMRRFADEQRQKGRRIGFVPTMGALHRGHHALIRSAAQHTDCLIVSIFVNPTQFSAGEDLDRYPRPIDDDLKQCQDLGVDAVFTPTAETMYPPGFASHVDVPALGNALCGRFRQGHFRGVCTVVAKLFNIVGSCTAVFGAKDFQQLQIIRRMVKDLNMPVDIVGMPTVREADGLAVSSRNRYLDGAQRGAAAGIYRALMRARDTIAVGTWDTETVIGGIKRDFASSTPALVPQYVVICDAETFEPLDSSQGLSDSMKVLIAVAAHLGHTRLIDNMVLWPSGELLEA